MLEARVGSTATVILTMEIQTSGSTWGGDCTVAQVHKQAKDQAYGFIAGLQREHPHEIVSYSIDKVKVITHERDAK